jgi:hypothetical protein
MRVSWFGNANPAPLSAALDSRRNVRPMTDADVHDEIARLEAELEERSGALERCRKVILVSKLIAAAGGLLLLLHVLGVVWLEPAVTIGAMAAVIGGIVAFGSNTTTANQLSEAMDAAETRRAELIGMLDLRTVTDGAQLRRLH